MSFAHLRHPTDGQINDLLESGRIVLDTNILLTLYKQSQEGRRQLFALLERIGDRVWIPNHVAEEFFTSRYGVILDQNKGIEPLKALIEKSRSEVLAHLNAELKKRNENDSTTTGLRKTVEGSFGTILAEIEQQLEVETLKLDDDAIMVRLDGILSGKVGLPPDPKTRGQWITNAKSRSENGQAPGFRDRAKARNSHGDYFVWAQILELSKSTSESILFVTDDKKEDWYQKIGDALIGPRTELLVEFYENSSARYWQMPLAEFTHHAHRHWGSDVEQVRQTAPIEKTSNSGALLPETIPGTWDPDSYGHLLARLTSEGYTDQVAAIEEAANNGWFISRAELYELIGRSAEQSLRQFSTPVIRIQRQLAFDGLISEDAEPALSARYTRPGQAVGYEVPQEFGYFVSDRIDEWVAWDPHI